MIDFLFTATVLLGLAVIGIFNELRCRSRDERERAANRAHKFDRIAAELDATNAKLESLGRATGYVYHTLPATPARGLWEGADL